MANATQTCRKPRYLVTRASWYNESHAPETDWYWYSRPASLADVLKLIDCDMLIGRDLGHDWDTNPLMRYRVETPNDLANYDMFVSDSKWDEYGEYRDGIIIRKMNGERLSAREFYRLAIMTETVWL